MSKIGKNNFYVAADDYWEHYKNFFEFQDVLSVSSKDFPLDKKIELFKKFVFLVNLELSTYCNRKCDYCPVSLYPREQEYMSEELFKKIIGELKDISYSGGIVLNFYNEPLLDNNLLEKTSYEKSR